LIFSEKSSRPPSDWRFRLPCSCDEHRIFFRHRRFCQHKTDHSARLHQSRPYKCLPAFVSLSLENALHAFSKQIEGFETGVLTAPETRTSFPGEDRPNAETMKVSMFAVYILWEKEQDMPAGLSAVRLTQ
jgi:hypothetical protein